ncbi:MAG: hypothetical protein ACT4QD_21080, partial [Acidobacteriota bacterium]
GLETRHMPQRADVPVHVLQPAPGVAARAMYVLLYGEALVENPFLFQIKTAGELLFSRRKAMTLFFALDPAAASVTPVEDLEAVRLLFAAIDAFVHQNALTTPVAR